MTPLEIYFAAVDAGDFQAAVQTFAESCIYARPPVAADRVGASGLELMVGREAVRAFLRRRGRIALVHHIHSATLDQRQCFVEGTARLSGRHTEHSSVFIAHANLDGEGLISRFVALSAALDRPTMVGLGAEAQSGPLD